MLSGSEEALSPEECDRASSRLTPGGEYGTPSLEGVLPSSRSGPHDWLAHCSLGEHAAHPRPQSCLHHPIRASITVVLMLKEFGKPLSGPVNPVLDRAKRGSAEFGDLLIAVTLHPQRAAGSP